MFRKHLGISLIELIIGIIIFGIALSVLTSSLILEAGKSNKATQHVKASMLGKSVMTNILNKRFSDSNIEQNYCNDNDNDNDNNKCSPKLGLEEKIVDILVMDDVDDFIGCWGSVILCENVKKPNYSVGQLINSNEYDKFTVEIDVDYFLSITGKDYKNINVIVRIDKYEKYQFSSVKGNY